MLVVLEACVVVHETVKFLKAFMLLLCLQNHDETSVTPTEHGALLAEKVFSSQGEAITLHLAEGVVVVELNVVFTASHCSDVTCYNPLFACVI